MQDRFQYVTVDTILSKYMRDFRGVELNEDEAIEWIGEALGFMQMASASEEGIAFLEVRNYQAALPNGLHYIIQVAKNNAWSPTDVVSCTPQVIAEELVPISSPDSCCGGWTDDLVAVDCQGELIGDQEIGYYRPYFDLQYEYLGWVHSKAYRTKFTPVRLANHSFFNSLVCQTECNAGLYNENTSSLSDEYTIVGDQLRFSFKEGYVAVAYLRQRVDQETGYPMIPDDESAKAAITYYLGWKTKEREAWNHREGAMQIAQVAEARWLKYIKQFKNKAKMPWGTDEYEDLMEGSNYLLPRRKRYYGFFGKLGQAEDRIFNDPNFTNKYRYTSGNSSYMR
jgi:hypothetical protein